MPLIAGSREAAAFLDDELYEDGLADLERRRVLDQTGQMAASIEVDLVDKGPLWRYLMARRDAAKSALVALVTADPRDGVAVASHQAAVKEYLQVCSWIAGRVEDGDRAAEIIKEDYPSDDDQDPERQD